MLIICIYILTLLETPDPPVNVTTYAPEPMAFRVNWTSSFDGNRQHQYFSLTIDTPDSTITAPNIVKNVSLEHTQPSYISYSQRIDSSENILPYTNYTITVRGCNIIGCSKSSNSSKKILTEQYSKF